MKRLLCAILGHRWVRTGINKWTHVYEWVIEYQCPRCKDTMWE